MHNPWASTRRAGAGTMQPGADARQPVADLNTSSTSRGLWRRCDALRLLMRVRLPLLATLACLSGCILAQPVGAAQARPHAKAALSEKYVKEQGHLHFTNKGGGAAIVEQGYATGTFNASLSIDLLVKVSKVTGSFTAYLKGGSISGYASATPHVSGQWVSFKGSLTIKHGSGAYAGASGTAGLYGSLNRNSLKLNVQLIGRLRI